MRRVTRCLLAGLAVASSTGLAKARDPSVHTLTIQLPDGNVEQVRYTGNTPPSVVIEPGSPFAALDRMMAAMDAQMASAMHEAALLADQSTSLDRLTPAALGAPSTCVRIVRIVDLGDGPEMTTSLSGDCAAVGPTPTAAPPKRRAPGTILARSGPSPDQLVEVASR